MLLISFYHFRLLQIFSFLSEHERSAKESEVMKGIEGNCNETTCNAMQVLPRNSWHWLVNVSLRLTLLGGSARIEAPFFHG